MEYTIRYTIRIGQDGVMRSSSGEIYTLAEQQAYALVGKGTIREAADTIITLAEQIKSERAVLGMR